MSEQYLVLTAVGADRPGIVAELTATLAERGANVADSVERVRASLHPPALATAPRVATSPAPAAPTYATPNGSRSMSQIRA